MAAQILEIIARYTAHLDDPTHKLLLAKGILIGMLVSGAIPSSVYNELCEKLTAEG